MKLFFEYLGLRLGVGLLGIVPNALSVPTLSWLLSHLHYRSDVIVANLTASLPSLSPEQVKKIKYEFYGNLANIMVQQAKASYKNSATYRNPELITEMAEKHGALLLLGSHYGCWETVGKKLTSLLTPLKQYVAYKKVKNPRINNYLLRRRSDTTAIPIEMSKVYRQIIENRDNCTPAVYYLIADQSPASLQNIRKATLLGLETWFVNGPEKISQKLKIPVVFMDTTITADGQYSVQFATIYDPSSEDGSVVDHYAKLLERQILRNPSHWLWSHKRWKNMNLYSK